MVIEELESLLQHALRTFTAAAAPSRWRGQREREAVSYFAFGYLAPRCRPGAVLHHPGQLAIEVPVPGIGTGKPQVCKDLVIWREPGETCWDAQGAPTVPPCAILEWKCAVEAPRVAHEPHDLAWLGAFTVRYPHTLGYLVRLNLSPRLRGLTVSRVRNGIVTEWLTLAVG